MSATSPELVDKTFEWLPQSYGLLGSPDADSQVVLSWFTLETAINTYADPKGHKIFESDTDLNYPPDRQRFLNFLGETVLGSLAYLAKLIAVSRDNIEVPDLEANLFPLAMAAGETDFAYLKKRTR